ncbi:MAG: class I SAM-dependent methyltransferase [Pirellulales bacterium]|nr:class I SAM-dependent methyltransferase [Pirellulales bacterium]
MLPEKTTPSVGDDPRIAFFNGLANRWDTTGQDPHMTICQVASHADRLQLRSGNDLLEVGCGTGQLTGWLAEQVAPGRVVAIDFAAEMLDEARRKKIPAEFRCRDICRDDIGISCFDVVLCFHSFPHFRDPVAAIRNSTRSLRPVGRFLVMHLSSRTKINAFHHDVGSAVGGDRLPADGTWHQMLSEVGWKVHDLVDEEDLFFLEAARAT